MKQGDALPPEKEWDNMTLDAKLDKIASDLDAAVTCNAPRTEYYVDPYDIDQARELVEGLSTYVFEYMKKTGQTL